MTAAASARESSVRDSSPARFTGPVVRSWPVVVLLTVYGLFVGALLPSVRPVGHTATAEVLLRPVIADPVANQRVDQLVSLDTEAVVLGSDEVLSKASEITGLTLVDLRSHLKVVAVPSSLVLRVSQTQEKPRDARLAADAITATYLQQRKVRAQRVVDTELTAITAQIAETAKRLDEVSARVTASPAGSADRASQQSLQTSTAQQLAALQTRQLTLQRTQTDSGDILRTADKTTTSGFGRSTTVPAGLLMGLLAGIVLAVLLDRLSRTVRRPDDVVRATGHRVLASVADGRLDPLLGPDDAEEPDARAYRRALLAIEPGADAVISVVGSGGTAEAGRVSSGIATVAARGGSDVALLLLEPGGAADDDTFQVTPLGRVLGADSAGAARPASTTVGRGQLTVYLGDPSLEELATPLTLSSAVAQLRGMHDLVIVEIEDPLGSALADGWIRAADHTAIAAKLRRTKSGELRTVAGHLADAGRPAAGTILIG